MKEKGFSQIENYMFEDHDMIKRAATECMCNMVVSEEVGLFPPNISMILFTDFSFASKLSF